jgi:hypothetical protein
MAESSTVTILRNKAAELEAAIVNYERQGQLARQNLIAVNMTLTLFNYSPDTPSSSTAPLSMKRMFQRNEMPKIMFSALAEHPEGLDTRELAIVALKAKGFDETNAVLRRGMAMKVVNTLDKLRVRQKIVKDGMRNGVVVWRLPT